jgi:hypothetical protein
MLTRERILKLFSELDDELCQADIRGDVFIVGGHPPCSTAVDGRVVSRRPRR